LRNVVSTVHLVFELAMPVWLGEGEPGKLVDAPEVGPSQQRSGSFPRPS
jgi:hypothetical protein